MSGVTQAQADTIADTLLTPQRRAMLADIERARQVAETVLWGAVAVALEHLGQAAANALRAELFGSAFAGELAPVVLNSDAAAAQVAAE